MTVQLPTRASFPSIAIAGAISPSLPHLDQHVEDIAESQHYEAAYYGRGHAGQSWEPGLAGCPAADTTERYVLTYMVIPRVHMTTLDWSMRYECTSSSATVTIRVECAENGETATVSSAGSVASRYESGSLEIMREDQLSTIRVYLTASAGTVYVESFTLRDADLSAADLHSDYYATTTTAAADGLVRYWAMQEDDDAGTDATAVDAMGSGDDLTASNGVTISSELVNGRRKFNRAFGTSDYAQGTYTYSRAQDFSWLIDVKQLTTSGSHTIFATGGNRVSIAANATSIQLEVTGTLAADWADALPFSESTALFVVHDLSAATVTLYSADGEGTVTQRAQRASSPAYYGQSVRVGRGYAGDINHQDTEYMDDGTVAHVAMWAAKALSAMEMNSIARCLRVRGALLVR